MSDYSDIPPWAALQAWNEAEDNTTLGEIRRRAREIAASAPSLPADHTTTSEENRP